MLARFRFLLAASIVTATAVTAVVACTTPVPRAAPLNTRDADDSTPDNGQNLNPDTQLGESDPVQADGGKPPGRVYAHTARVLFLYDPLAANGVGSIAEVGEFDCLETGDEMFDIAVDRVGNMYGTSSYGFLKVSPTDAKCTYLQKFSGVVNSYPNSLAFMPIGTVDATKEALVGYGFDADGHTTQFVRIDTTTGDLTTIGAMNAADPSGLGLQTQYQASGDIIGLSRSGNRAYVTVKEIPQGEAGTVNVTNDQLAEIDPKTGAIKSVIGGSNGTGLTQLYGLGQWAGQAYAFSGDLNGDVVQIDLDTGATHPVSVDAGSMLQWYGAGVTTAAPTKP